VLLPMSAIVALAAVECFLIQMSELMTAHVRLSIALERALIAFEGLYAIVVIKMALEVVLIVRFIVAELAMEEFHRSMGQEMLFERVIGFTLVVAIVTRKSLAFVVNNLMRSQLVLR